MDERHLHIICLDVPWPVDYGGVFDIYHKIKALHEAGIKIHLHCFEYGRGQQTKLNEICVSVSYYPRKSFLSSITSDLPYIVSSRQNDELLENLQKDDYPILMEGIHCTYELSRGRLPRNRCFVRLHNVEWKYYKQLAETTTSTAKKIYYNRESKLLLAYERNLAGKATFWTVTKNDLQDFEDLGYSNIDYLPVYVPDFSPKFEEGQGTYCLYHGNLGVAENEEAAIWLLQEVFNEIEIPFVVAGKNPSSKLEYLAHKNMHTCLVANPDEREMTELLKKAQLHVLPSFNCTGIKLKLLNALRLGRHCIVNQSAIAGTGLDDFCIIANSCDATKNAVSKYFETPFSSDDFMNRQAYLSESFSNKKNAKQMIRWIFEGEPTIPGTSISWRG